MQRVHEATIINHKLEFLHKDFLAKCLRGYEEGEKLEVIVRKRKSQRSIRQNKYYFGVVLKLIAEDQSEDINYVHWCMSDKFLKRVEFNRLTKKETIYTPSTTKLKTDQFEKYLEAIRKWASKELNIYIPLPNEVDVDNIVINEYSN